MSGSRPGAGAAGPISWRTPARAGAVVAIAIFSVAAMFTGGNISSGRREDTRNRWILLPFMVPGLPPGVAAGVYRPPRDLDDRRRRGPLPGAGVFVVGSVFRLTPVFVLGRRFSGLVAIQEGHELVTDGLYRVIRHPSYLGLLLALFGWDLIFRSAIGVVVSLLLLPPLVARMNSEEALLQSEFGERYSDYRRVTCACFRSSIESFQPSPPRVT